VADTPPRQFDGGYAPVIRATDIPVRQPGRGRHASHGTPGTPGSYRAPGNPARARSRPEDGTPADVFIYREPDPEADAREEHEAAYWYDLAAAEREPAAPPVSEIRGPFEPLVSSGGPPPDQAPPSRAEPDPAAATPATDAQGPVGTTESGVSRAQKLEQIKDLYLTAEAIGEENVGKHFDELLAQQRALISDYFKKSPEAETETDPGPHGSADSSGHTQGAGVAAERPGAR
jgi:hypothetical protein